jgi:hypothetical protein
VEKETARLGKALWAGDPTTESPGHLEEGGVGDDKEKEDNN